MGKSKFIIALSAIIIALVVYRKPVNDVEPEIMPEDVWWGLKSDHTKNSGDTEIRSFQINISDTVIILS